MGGTSRLENEKTFFLFTVKTYNIPFTIIVWIYVGMSIKLWRLAKNEAIQQDYGQSHWPIC